MKYSNLFPYLIVFLILAACQAGPEQQSQAQSLSAANRLVLTPGQFQEKQAALPNAVLVDVRTPAEFATGHIPGAVNIDVKNGTFDSELDKLPKNQPVLVYCRSGMRSATAAKRMAEKGFLEIYEMKGGMLQWQAEGRATE